MRSLAIEHRTGARRLPSGGKRHDAARNITLPDSRAWVSGTPPGRYGESGGIDASLQDSESQDALLSQGVGCDRCGRSVGRALRGRSGPRRETAHSNAPGCRRGRSRDNRALGARRKNHLRRKTQSGPSCSSVWAPADGDVVVCQPQPAVICDLLRICCAGPLGPSILPLVPHLDRGYRGSVAKIIAGSDFNPDGTSFSVLMRAVNHI